MQPSSASKRSLPPLSSSNRPHPTGGVAKDMAILMGEYGENLSGNPESDLLNTLQKTVEQNNQLIEENTLLNQHLE
jgi:hypothetical protein